MATESEQINFFAKTNFRNRQVPFGIKTDDRRRHMYIVGKTGMGKSTMMENMAIQDIRNGKGVCFIDPHGDLVQNILNYIPNERINDVVYFNPSDLDNPIAFNILEAVDSRYKHLVASGLMGVFTKIWASMWSARMEYILNNTILALLDSPGNTMMGIVRMYVDKKYRKKIVDSCKDPMVKSFWLEEFANYAEKYRTEAVAPIQNKVGQFLSSAVVRNIVGQPKSTIDLREIMDNQKILLLDLSKGKVGEDNSALLGAMIITKLQLAALSRVDQPESERKDFYLYVDEFQNFVTDSFATILSEARKYRLNLIMGHQYIAQLAPDNNTKVRDAVFGNVGTMVVFRVGAADAEYLETEFEPSFTPTDIVNIPKYNVILKLMINGVSSDPFTATGIKADENWYTGNAEKVIKVSRERYGNKLEDVEDKINRWMGAEFHEATAESVSGDPKATQDRLPEARPAYTPRPQSAPTSIRRVPVAKDEPAPANQQSETSKAPASKIMISADFKERMQKSQQPASPVPAAASANTPKSFAPKPFSPKPSAGNAQNNNPRPPQNKPAPKKLNNSASIWDAAANMEASKHEKIADSVADAISHATQAPKPATNNTPANEEHHPATKALADLKERVANNGAQVIQPGETHTL